MNDLTYYFTKYLNPSLFIATLFSSQSLRNLRMLYEYMPGILRPGHTLRSCTDRMLQSVLRYVSYPHIEGVSLHPC